MKIFYKEKIIIFLIFLLAFILRLYGLNWDSNSHLHPDERFLTMVANDVGLPSSFSQYLDTKNSPLNPYNYPQYSFFVYGTFPLFLTKFLAVFLHLDTYNHLTLLGRILSAFFDSGNVILLYFLAKKILKSFYLFLPSLFYALLILPIQLSHFFIVDTFLTFFILLTFTLLTYRYNLLAFITFGLALACKISALYFVPVIFLLLFLQKKKISFLFTSSLYFLFSLLFFRLFQPYAFDSLFLPNPAFISNLKTLALFSSVNGSYPPSIQWLHRIPLLNSFSNLTIWGLGLSISLPLLIFSISFLFKDKFKFKFNLPFIIFFWSLFLFLFQGLQFTHTMRYFLPIYPFICLLFAALLFRFRIKRSLIIFILISNLIYTSAFLSIYSRPNSRIQASEWIIKNISLDKTISSEYWDDALPLYNDGHKIITLDLYAPDTPEKWDAINESLSSLDYLVLSSNRLWSSIPRAPEKYPQASKFYEDLFSGKSNFTLIKKFTSYPGFSLSFLNSCYYFGPSNYPGIKNTWFSVDKNCSYPGLYLRDDTAEEAFTVYDHPQVLIFARK